MSKPIKFTCSCGRILSAKPELAGRQGKCPGCHRVFIVPRVEIGEDLELIDEAAAEVTARSDALSGAFDATSRRFTDDEWEASQTYGLASAQVACPSCGAAMQEDAILCIDCGFNRQTGQQQTARNSEEAEVPRERIRAWQIGLIYTLFACVVGMFVPVLAHALMFPMMIFCAIVGPLSYLWYVLLLMKHDPDRAGLHLAGWIVPRYAGRRLVETRPTQWHPRYAKVRKLMHTCLWMFGYLMLVTTLMIPLMEHEDPPRRRAVQQQNANPQLPRDQERK